MGRAILNQTHTCIHPRWHPHAMLWIKYNVSAQNPLTKPLLLQMFTFWFWLADHCVLPQFVSSAPANPFLSLFRLAFENSRQHHRDLSLELTSIRDDVTNIWAVSYFEVSSVGDRSVHEEIHLHSSCFVRACMFNPSVKGKSFSVT